MNSAIPGDLRDTSTPQAMAETLKKLVFNEILDFGGRQQMQTWLKNNTTGAMRIRAGVPEDFIVGDKTGGGGYGTTNDMGVIWPGRDRSPIVLAIFFGRITEDEAKASHCNEIIQDVTKLVVREFELKACKHGINNSNHCS